MLEPGISRVQDSELVNCSLQVSMAKCSRAVMYQETTGRLLVDYWQTDRSEASRRQPWADGHQIDMKIGVRTRSCSPTSAEHSVLIVVAMKKTQCMHKISVYLHSLTGLMAVARRTSRSMRGDPAGLLLVRGWNHMTASVGDVFCR